MNGNYANRIGERRIGDRVDKELGIELSAGVVNIYQAGFSRDAGSRRDSEQGVYSTFATFFSSPPPPSPPPPSDSTRSACARREVC